MPPCWMVKGKSRHDSGRSRSRRSPRPAGRAKLVSMTSLNDDPTCDVAHGAAPAVVEGRVLVAVFASPVAEFLVRYGRDAGYRPVLVEPDPERAKAAVDVGLAMEDGIRSHPDGPADVVVTDHHRPELGPMLRDALASDARWVGIMGHPRHPAPHIPALAGLRVAGRARDRDAGRPDRRTQRPPGRVQLLGTGRTRAASWYRVLRPKQQAKANRDKLA